MNRQNLLILFLIITFGIMGCSDSNDADELDFNVLVLNQGQFGNGNASITAWNTSTSEGEQEYFRQNTNRPLGDVAQSARIIEDDLVIVVNNSHKLEIVDPVTFESKQTVSFEDGTSPRYVQEAGDLIFVTTFSDDVLVLNSDYEVIERLEIGARTEGIGLVDNRIIVAESFFADFSSASHLSVINTSTFEVEERIELRSGPSAVFVDSESKIWVTTSGDFGEDNGAVYVLDGTTFEQIEVIELGSSAGAFTVSEAQGMAFISGGGQVRSIDLTTYELGEVTIEKGYYGLGFRIQDGQLFAADAKDFTQAGSVSVYDLTGSKIEEFDTGIAPGAFFFLD